MFELRDLECFLAIVEHKTFHKAAKACGMAQPPLSRRIAALERELGGALFSRDSRRTQLTELGTVFAREARIVLEQAHVAQRVATDFGRGVTGRLRVGYVGSSGYTIVPLAMRSFRQAFPQATISVEAVLGHRQVEALRIGTIDLAINRGAIDSSGLRVRRLRSDRFLLALADGHRLVDRTRVPVTELSEEPFIALTPSPMRGTSDIVRTICANAGFVPHVVQEVDTYAVLVSCVSLGIGISLVSESIRSFSVRGVMFRDLSPEPPPADLNAVTRLNDENPLIPAFIDHLLEAAKNAY
jgi:DNA-binding transcriptional LysR family regulator